MTSGVALDFHLAVGSSWTVGGVSRKVTGIVQNPQNLLDEFALVAPGQVTAPTQVTVLFDAPGVMPSDIGPTVATPQTAASNNVVNPETISLAAAVLGMLLIAMVGAGGFTVLAQRRLRAIGMLAAQGATQANIRLVVRANGVATGVVGAVAGFVLGLVAWLTRQVPLAVEANWFSTDPNGGQRAAFSATAQINRGDFGIDRWTGGGAVVGDKVPISLKIEAVLQQCPGRVGCRIPAAHSPANSSDNHRTCTSTPASSARSSPDGGDHGSCLAGLVAVALTSAFPGQQ